MSMTVATGGKLALVMIARDGERTISRCLRSVAPYVDQLLVLDTGSCDNTVEIARACGADVHHMPWPGSFAVARNRALDLADADWNLVLDADEWLMEGGEGLRGSLADMPGAGVVRVDSFTGTSAETAVCSDWITRLLPRGVRYEGTVHEQPVLALARHRLPLVIGHDGYRPEAMQIKRGRNRALLQAALDAVNGQDPYLLFQLGKDFEAYGELPAAAEQYRQALSLNDPRAPYWPQLVVRAMHCLGKSGQLSEALALASDHLDRLEASVEFQFTLGDLCLDVAVAHPQDAVGQWLPLAEAAWLRCLDLGEHPEQGGSVAGRGSFLAAHNLHVIYSGLGDEARSAHYQDLSERMRGLSQGARISRAASVVG
jgi:hypothetical protein